MDLQSNQLARLEDLNLLRKYVCCLTHLNLSANPLSKGPSYQPLILRRLPHLATLDGRTLSQTDWEAAAASHGLLTVPMLEQCGSTRLLSIWSTLGKSLQAIEILLFWSTLGRPLQTVGILLFWSTLGKPLKAGGILLFWSTLGKPLKGFWSLLFLVNSW